jgi:hypothetical protein
MGDKPKTVGASAGGTSGSALNTAERTKPLAD